MGSALPPMGLRRQRRGCSRSWDKACRVTSLHSRGARPRRKEGRGQETQGWRCPPARDPAMHPEAECGQACAPWAGPAPAGHTQTFRWPREGRSVGEGSEAGLRELPEHLLQAMGTGHVPSGMKTVLLQGLGAGNEGGREEEEELRGEWGGGGELGALCRDGAQRPWSCCRRGQGSRGLGRACPCRESRVDTVTLGGGVRTGSERGAGEARAGLSL